MNNFISIQTKRQPQAKHAQLSSKLTMDELERAGEMLNASRVPAEINGQPLSLCERIGWLTNEIQNISWALAIANGCTCGPEVTGYEAACPSCRAMHKSGRIMEMEF